MATKDIFQTMVAIGVVVGMVIGAITYFATAEDLRLTQMRLEQKIQADKAYNLQEQIWQLEDKYTVKGKLLPCEQWKPEDRKRYQILKYEFERTKEVVK